MLFELVFSVKYAYNLIAIRWPFLTNIFLNLSTVIGPKHNIFMFFDKCGMPWWMG